MPIAESDTQSAEPSKGPRRAAYFGLGATAVVGSIYIGVNWSPSGWLEYLVAGFGWILGGFLLIGRLAGRRDVLVGTYVVGVFAGWVVVIGIFVLGRPIDDYFSRLDFDSAAWKRDAIEDGERPARQRMVHDLLERGLLRRCTVAEVESLLGEPDAGQAGPDGEITFALGPDRGFGIDTELFGIRFDAAGKVVETYLRSD